MCRAGLNDPNSKCTIDRNQLMNLSLNLVTGKAGTDVVVNFYHLLHAPKEDMWLQGFDLPRESCFDTIVSGMCDAWRRLVLPFSGLPWVVFKVVKMDPEEGLNHLRRIGLQTASCEHCQDRFFTKASLPHVGGL